MDGKIVSISEKQKGRKPVQYSVLLTQSEQGISFSINGVKDEPESREAVAKALESVIRKLREGA